MTNSCGRPPPLTTAHPQLATCNIMPVKCMLSESNPIQWISVEHPARLISRFLHSPRQIHRWSVKRLGETTSPPNNNCFQNSNCVRSMHRSFQHRAPMRACTHIWECLRVSWMNWLSLFLAGWGDCDNNKVPDNSRLFFTSGSSLLYDVLMEPDLSLLSTNQSTTTPLLLILCSGRMC